MHLLTPNDSGRSATRTNIHFVLAGVSVFEREPHWIEQELDKIAARFAPDQPHSVELHGSPMRTGRDGWDQHPRAAREQAMLDALNHGILDRNALHVRLFGVY